jgi:hypothetical protein
MAAVRLENEDTHQFVGHRVSESMDKGEEVVSALSGKITMIIWRLIGLPAGSSKISDGSVLHVSPFLQTQTSF